MLNCCLQSIIPEHVDNASLVYEKLKFRGSQSNTLGVLNISKATSIHDAFVRSRDAFYTMLQNQGLKISLWELKLKSELLICTAGGTAESAGISLHSLTGYPFIPATSLKGVSRAVAVDNFPENVVELFGSEAKRGQLVFFPAYVISSNPCLTTSGITPHQVRVVPLTFPAVASGTRFKFAVIGDVQYLEELFIGVGNNGLGAKTSSGFGWCEISKISNGIIVKPNQPTGKCEPSQSEIDGLKFKVSKLSELNEIEQRELLCNPHVKKFINEWKNMKKKKDCYAVCVTIAAKLSIPL